MAAAEGEEELDALGYEGVCNDVTAVHRCVVTHTGCDGKCTAGQQELCLHRFKD